MLIAPSTPLALALLLAVPAPVQQLREEAEAVWRVQTILEWYTRTQGEPSVSAATYKGHERLFSKESIAQVTRALKDKSLPPDERRALEFFKAYLANEVLGLQTAHFNDEAQNAELKATARLSWEKDPVPYKQLEILANDEKDAARREEIEQARAQIWKDVLNPILARKEEAVQKLARELGYASYVALSEEYRRVDLKWLIAEGERFTVATDAVYRPLLDEVAQKELGVPAAKLRRADLGRLRKAPRFERYFPKELMIPSFLHFLSGIGLDMKTVAGTEIRVDDAPHPLKEPRAACFNVRVPADVRITVKPTGGLSDVTTFFHEGGHAVHFANTTSKLFELQNLGPNTWTEGVGELFGYSWDDPLWLRRYRAFVTQYNAEHGTKYPTMTDAEISELVRLRVFNDLYFLRRYASAKLVYEAVLHAGAPELWKGVYTKPTSDPMAVYRDTFERAYGFPLTEDDALRFRTDVDDTFYAADYSRAFGLAHLAHEGLRKKFGGESGDWYGDKRVGALLKTLFADGQKLQGDEAAQAFGFERLDFRPAEERIKRLLEASRRAP